MLGRLVAGHAGGVSVGHVVVLSLRALASGLLAAAAALAQPGTLDTFGSAMIFVMGAILIPALIALACAAPQFRPRSFTINVVVASVVYAALVALTYERGGDLPEALARGMALVALLGASLMGVVAVGLPLYTVRGARGTRR